MTQVAQIVQDTLLELRVIGSNEAPDDDDARDCVRSLNTMMREWEVDGIALGWSDVMDVTDTLHVPPEAEGALTFNLAVRMAAQFGKELRQDTVAKADAGKTRLMNQIALNECVPVSYPDLPIGNNQPYGTWRDGYFM
jgi:citrate lyase gamma subunit